MRPMPTMPSLLPSMRWPSIQVGDRRPQPPAGNGVGALDDAPGDGENQRHGHVGGIVGEHARRIGDGDAAFCRSHSTSILSTPLPKLAISLRRGPAGLDHGRINAIGNGGDQHVG